MTGQLPGSIVGAMQSLLELQQHLTDRKSLVADIVRNENLSAQELAKGIAMKTGLKAEFECEQKPLHHPPLADKSLTSPWSIKVSHRHQGVEVATTLKGETRVSLTVSDGERVHSIAAHITHEGRTYGLGDLEDIEKILLDKLLHRGAVSEV